MNGFSMFLLVIYTCLPAFLLVCLLACFYKKAKQPAPVGYIVALLILAGCEIFFLAYIPALFVMGRRLLPSVITSPFIIFFFSEPLFLLSIFFVSFLGLRKLRAIKPIL